MGSVLPNTLKRTLLPSLPLPPPAHPKHNPRPPSRLLDQVYGDKDTDGFYRGEVCGRMGLIPCNMVSEIRAEDDETLEQLIKQGFLPLNTPIDRIGTARAPAYRGLI